MSNLFMLPSAPKLDDVLAPIKAMAEALDKIHHEANAVIGCEDLTLQDVVEVLRAIRSLAERAPGA